MSRHEGFLSNIFKVIIYMGCGVVGPREVFCERITRIRPIWVIMVPLALNTKSMFVGGSGGGVKWVRAKEGGWLE